MPTELWLFLAIVVVFAAWLVVHVVSAFQSLRAREIAWPYRLLAVVPPATPVIAWWTRHRIVAVVWSVLFVAYVVLRLVTE